MRGNVELGVAETKALLDQFNAINMKFAEPMSDDEMNDLLAEQADVQEKIDAAGRLGARAQARCRCGRAAPAALGCRGNASIRW